MEGLVGGSERSQKAREKRARQWVIQETPFLVSCFACGLRYVSCRVDASVCNVDVKDATMLLLQRCEVLLMQVSVCVMLLMLLRACASVRACRRMPFADPNATHASRKHACNPPQPSPPKSNTPPTNMAVNPKVDAERVVRGLLEEAGRQKGRELMGHLLGGDKDDADEAEGGGVGRRGGEEEQVYTTLGR
eukprot:2068550-Rhodomonas_salina.1